MTWRTDGDMPQKITVQLFPATDSDKLARVVAVIADKLSPDVTSVAFVIPENIPAWYVFFVRSINVVLMLVKDVWHSSL